MMSKTKDLIIDFRKGGDEPAPIFINRGMVERMIPVHPHVGGWIMECQYHRTFKEGTTVALLSEIEKENKPQQRSACYLLRL